MATEMEKIERLAAAFSHEQAALVDEVNALQDAIAALKREHIAAIKRAVRSAAATKADLRDAIEANPALFERPKTRILHAIRIGFRKKIGEIKFGDEEKTVHLIRDLLPANQAKLLIRVRESVDKNAMKDLTVPDLKRLGIAIEADTDVVVIKPIDSDVDKLVAALLADAERVEEAA